MIACVLCQVSCLLCPPPNSFLITLLSLEICRTLGQAILKSYYSWLCTLMWQELKLRPSKLLCTQPSVSYPHARQRPFHPNSSIWPGEREFILSLSVPVSQLDLGWVASWSTYKCLWICQPSDCKNGDIDLIPASNHSIGSIRHKPIWGPHWRSVYKCINHDPNHPPTEHGQSCTQSDQMVSHSCSKESGKSVSHTHAHTLLYSWHIYLPKNCWAQQELIYIPWIEVNRVLLPG